MEGRRRHGDANDPSLNTRESLEWNTDVGQPRYGIHKVGQDEPTKSLLRKDKCWPTSRKGLDISMQWGHLASSHVIYREQALTSPVQPTLRTPDWPHRRPTHRREPGRPSPDSSR